MIYEYKIVTMDTSSFWFGGDVDEKKLLKKIESLAKDKWELISTAPITEGTMKGFGSTNSLLLFFKRPKK